MNDTNYANHIRKTDDELESLLFGFSIDSKGMMERENAVQKILERYGEQTVPKLISLLNEEEGEEELSWMAAECLGELKDSRAVQPLIDALSSEWFQLRYESALALEQIGDERSKPHYERALADIYSDEDLDAFGCGPWENEEFPFRPPTG